MLQLKTVSEKPELKENEQILVNDIICDIKSYQNSLKAKNVEKNETKTKKEAKMCDEEC